MKLKRLIFPLLSIFFLTLLVSTGFALTRQAPPRTQLYASSIPAKRPAALKKLPNSLISISRLSTRSSSILQKIRSISGAPARIISSRLSPPTAISPSPLPSSTSTFKTLRNTKSSSKKPPSPKRISKRTQSISSTVSNPTGRKTKRNALSSGAKNSPTTSSPSCFRTASKPRS